MTTGIDTENDWAIALAKELSEILVFTTHRSFSRQDAIDRLHNIEEWLRLSFADSDEGGDREPGGGEIDG